MVLTVDTNCVTALCLTAAIVGTTTNTLHRYGKGEPTGRILYYLQ